MPRNWFVNGPSLVKVKGGDHWATGTLSGKSNVALELGLAVSKIRVAPTLYRENLKADDYGKNAAPDVQWNLANVTVHMTLSHYDDNVLSLCRQDMMAVPGALNTTLFGLPTLDGTAAPAGTPMGKGLPMFFSGNNLISLNILSEEYQNPWRFKSCYLADTPFDYPLGMTNSEVILTWTAIPYQPLFIPTPLAGNIGQPILAVQQYLSSGSMNFQELSSSGVVIWDHVADA